MALPKQLKRFLNSNGQSIEYTLKADSRQPDRLSLKVLSAKVKGSPLHSQIQALDLFPTDVTACIEQALSEGWQPESAGPVFELTPDTLRLKVTQTKLTEQQTDFQLLPVIEKLSGELQSVDQISDADLLNLLADQFADWLIDTQAKEMLLQSFLELAPGLSGGFSLLVDRQILVQPGCCCGLWSLPDWEAALEADVGAIWTGHGQQEQVRFERGLRHIYLAVPEPFLIPINVFQQMINQTHQSLQRLSQRLAPLLNQLFDTEQGAILAKSLIFKQSDQINGLPDQGLV